MDVGVRDGDHPGVGGDGHLGLVRAEQLAGEAAQALPPAAGADPGGAADEAAEVAGAITPVPGGVGPMTIACLLRNTVVAAHRRERLPEPEGL